MSTLWAATAVSVAQATTLSAVACASGTPNVMSLYLVDIIDVIYVHLVTASFISSL